VKHPLNDNTVTKHTLLTRTHTIMQMKGLDCTYLAGRTSWGERSPAMPHLTMSPQLRTLPATVLRWPTWHEGRPHRRTPAFLTPKSRELHTHWHTA